jgi:hypothetical protein
VGEDRAFRHTGRAARVLQECDVLRGRLDASERAPAARIERVVEAHMTRQRILRHHLLDAPCGVIDDDALREAEQVAGRGNDHVLDRGLRDRLLQRRGEILQQHDHLGAGVLDLVLELARRIERVHVHHDAAGAQHADQRDRVLQDIGHHDGDARSAREPEALKPCGESGRVAVEVGESEPPIHERIGIALRVLGEPVLDEMDER